LLLHGVEVRSLRMNARHFVTIVFLGVLPAVGYAQGTDDARSLRFWRVSEPLVGTTVGLRDSASSGVSPVQVGSILVGGGIGITAAFIGNDVDPPTCAPCDPADLPAIDRWSVRTEQAVWGRASDVVVLGMVGGTWVDLWRREGGSKHLLTSMESFAWTLAVTQLLKNGTDRLRPVMYTEDAVDAADDPSSQRSFPSGHTSTAFSVATSYFLSYKKLTGESRWWVFAPAVFVGVARVAAAKHFTTDVLAGAAIGVATSLVVYEIRF